MSLCCYKKALMYYISSPWFQIMFILNIIPLLIFTMARRYYMSRKKAKTIAFFHPYCNAGGGGERVLWQAIKATQRVHPSYAIYVYTGDLEVTGEQILKRVKDRFNIEIKDVNFIFLKNRTYLQAERYPSFTLLGQSLGSLVVAWEALNSLVPEIFVDTMGYAFSAPVFRWLAAIRTAAYIHYPTISEDMLALVRDSFRPDNSSETYNNSKLIASSKLLSSVKLIYYQIFALIYGFCGRRFQLALTNSSWTRNHIDSIWALDKDRIHTVYPPCDTSEFNCLPMGQDDGATVISIGQFRPEKDHNLQIKSFAKFLSKVKDSDRYKLLLVGSCRDEGDEKRVEDLKKLANTLKVTSQVQFHLNVSFDKLKQLLTESTIGLHTMWNEHFGIGVVECMAGGTVMLAHNSAGPKQDIVVPFQGNRTGYLADDVDSYSNQLHTIFALSIDERNSIMQNARKSVERFSDDHFQTKFLLTTRFLFNDD